jgi:uncharacterized OsmC-like protein/esterase/lipase
MKFNFQNQTGETLSGRLELPQGPLYAFALFAHCFTCSKDVVAASTISRKLTDKGLAVLRFDFTGLGNSEGDFSNTNFSSNVQDLISAYKALSEKYQAPQVLVGHSLGGAAVLKAAPELPEVKAVVTIGAPSSVEHVSHLFANDIQQINEKGEAAVQLAGREFLIKKQFIDDIQQIEVLSGVQAMKKALLVLHSPVDNTVSIDHAAEIFLAAKHPKSFVTLDTADHLLMNRQDATYAADLIGSWVSRYIDTDESKAKYSLKENEILVTNRKGFKYTQDIHGHRHSIVADEPKSVKGDDLGMNPYELLLSSLGACTAMTIRMYADRKNFDLQNVEVKLSHERIYAQDCDDCHSTTGKVDQIHKHIKIEGHLTTEERARLLEIAERCPVNKTLQSEVKVRSYDDSSL